VLRLGPVHYNTVGEVEYVLDCLEQILAAAAR
jgi:selenocysteine lyase/cysteine desulfurase